MSLINVKTKIYCNFKIDGYVACLEYTANESQKEIGLLVPKELRRKDQATSNALKYLFTQKKESPFIVNIGELEEILSPNFVEDIKKSNLPKKIKQNIQGI